MTLEIAIPVYNEELRLRDGVQGLIQFLDQHGLPASVVIADNGSKDQTLKMAREMAAVDPRIRVIAVGEKGVGRALKAAWGSSGADLIGYVDVDHSTDLKHLLQMRTIFEQESVDFVNGSRLMPEAQVTGRRAIRTLSSVVMNFIIRHRLGIQSTDAMCGFKFLKRSVYEKISSVGLVNNGWFFNAEILIKSEWAQFQIREIPVKWDDDPRSKVKLVRLSLEYLGNIWELARDKARWRKEIGHRAG